MLKIGETYVPCCNVQSITPPIKISKHTYKFTVYLADNLFVDYKHVKKPNETMIMVEEAIVPLEIEVARKEVIKAMKDYYHAITPFNGFPDCVLDSPKIRLY